MHAREARDIALACIARGKITLRMTEIADRLISRDAPFESSRAIVSFDRIEEANEAINVRRLNDKRAGVTPALL